MSKIDSHFEPTILQSFFSDASLAERTMSVRQEGHVPITQEELLQLMFNNVQRYVEEREKIPPSIRQHSYKKMEALVVLMDSLYDKKPTSEIPQKPDFSRIKHNRKAYYNALTEYYKKTLTPKTLKEISKAEHIDSYRDAMLALGLLKITQSAPPVYQLNSKNPDALLPCFHNKFQIAAINLKAQFDYIKQQLEINPKFKVTKDRKKLMSNYMLSILENSLEQGITMGPQVDKYMNHLIKEHLNKRHKNIVKLSARKVGSNILDKMYHKRVVARNAKRAELEKIVNSSEIRIRQLLGHIAPINLNPYIAIPCTAAATEEYKVPTKSMVAASKKMAFAPTLVRSKL